MTGSRFDPDILGFVRFDDKLLSIQAPFRWKITALLASSEKDRVCFPCMMNHSIRASDKDRSHESELHSEHTSWMARVWTSTVSKAFTGLRARSPRVYPEKEILNNDGLSVYTFDCWGQASLRISEIDEISNGSIPER